MLLSEIVDTQLKMFLQFGVQEHFDYSKRYLLLKNQVPDFKKLFHETRTSPFCGITKPLFFNDRAFTLALDNFEIGRSIFPEGLTSKIQNAEIHYRLRNRNDNMPEALWCMPISKEGINIARLGINFHYEEEKIIASIVNVQGTNNFGNRDRKPNKLISRYWTIESMERVISDLGQNIDSFRGLPSNSHPSRKRDGFDKHRASCLYDLSFRRLGMNIIRDENNKVDYYEMLV